MEALSLALCAIVAAPAAALAQGDIVEIISKSSDGMKLGTGFCFGGEKQLIATCYHCVIGAKQIEVYHGSGVFSSDKSNGDRVEILAVDADHDLAILQVFGRKMGSFSIVSDADSLQSLLKSRVEVIVRGFPHGMPLLEFGGNLVRQGFIRADQIRDSQNAPMFPDGTSSNIIPFEITAAPGSSGGPVLISGKVIGILSGTMSPDFVRTLAWAVPTSDLARLMDSTTEAEHIGRDPGRIKHWPPLSKISSPTARKTASIPDKAYADGAGFVGVWQCNTTDALGDSQTIVAVHLFKRDDPRYLEGKSIEEAREEAREQGGVSYGRYKLGSHGWFEYAHWSRRTGSKDWIRLRNYSGLVYLRSPKWMTCYAPGAEKSLTSDPLRATFHLVLEEGGNLRLNYAKNVWAQPDVSERDLSLARLTD
jgi:S1-C subfamily serine protease